jgi:hypothetical protein
VEAQRVGVDLEERERKVTDYLKVPASEPIPLKVRSEYPPTVPLSVLALDLDGGAPIGGWTVWLAERGIAVAFDDIGRPAISRADAKQLLAAQRQDQIRKQDLAARLEAEAVEKDRAWRASLPRGAAWYDIPAGVHPATAMLQRAKDAQPRRTPSQVEWMFGEADTMVYHELPAEDES